MSLMSSREAAEVVCGRDAVENYGRVKTFYTRYGHALEAAFAKAVGGRVGERGEVDVITRLGEWAFCTQGNTKNAHGAAADLLSVNEGFAVQVLGRPNPGWISGIEFLRMHGIRDAEAVAARCQAEALDAARAVGSQLSLLIGQEVPRNELHAR